MLLGPVVLARSDVAYGSVDAASWGLAGDTFSYFYDGNGSLTYKYYGDFADLAAAQASAADYDYYEYNLRNRLVRVTKNRDTTPDTFISEYAYNPSGIRVWSRSYETTSGGSWVIGWE